MLNNKIVLIFKIGVFLILFMFVSNHCKAQSKKMFVIPGIAFLADNGRTEAYVREYSLNDTPYKRYNSAYYFSFFDLSLNYRYNLVELNESAAFGINYGFGFSASMALIHDRKRGLEGGFSGLLKLNTPVYFSFEKGAGATFSSCDDYGLSVGLGFELNKAPVFKFNDYGSEVYLDSFWAQPIGVLGYRYWNAKNKLIELNLKLGVGSKQDFPTDGGGSFDVSSGDPEMSNYRPYTIRISFRTYFNYK